MLVDFTIAIYNRLLNAIITNGYTFNTFEQYISEKSSNADKKKCVVLRHDIDSRPKHALKLAIIENELGITASFYFRIVRQSNQPHIIEQIVEMGHELGYHYEDLSLSKGNFEVALSTFQQNLQYFNTYYPIKTICMHGSPTSKWDNKLMWKRSSYEDFGLIGEPYFDVDFEQVGYLTDTGRKWNATHENVRDKVSKNLKFNFRTTEDIIDAFNQNIMPDTLMINVHPQRWTNNILLWSCEFVAQTMKNPIKRWLSSFNDLKDQYPK